jgi:sugar phosphate isomerase/epimerase
VLLSLAAGTVLDASPEQAIDAAAEAGFDALGLRFTEPPSERRLAELSGRIGAAGLSVLDVEVVRLGPGVDAAAMAWLVDVAGVLGARYVLTVSDDPDLDRTQRGIEALCDRAAPLGVAIALEYMAFTAVRDLAAAHAIVESSARTNAAVLVDVLHLARSGGDAAALRGPHGTRAGYVQICDGPAAGPATDEALRDEARHHRLMPGTGELPVVAVLDAVGDVPVSVEVQSDELAATMSVPERAELAARTARSVLARTRAKRHELT